MEIREYLQVIQRWFWLILVGMVAATIIALIVSLTQKPIYEASTMLLVSRGGVGDSEDVNAISGYSQLAQSYVQRLTNYEVLTEAVGNIGIAADIEELEESITVVNLRDTQLIELKVEHTDPRIARDLAIEIPKVFAERNAAQQLSRFSDSKDSLLEELDKLSLELNEAEEALAAENSLSSPDQTKQEQLRSDISLLRNSRRELLGDFETLRVAEAQNLNNIFVDEQARLPQEPVRPIVWRNALLAAIVGAMGSLAIAFLIEYFDDTIKTPEDVGKLVNLPVLGGVATIEGETPADRLVMKNEPRSPLAESFRRIRTNLQFSAVARDIHSILVTSPNQAEGKSTTAANLAAALAQNGKTVILVDADMRRPTLHKIYQKPNNSGLSNLIIDKENSERYLQKSDIPGLRILTSGPIPPNQTEMLGSQRMEETLGYLESLADYVVVDSPPTLAVTDSSILTRLVSVTVLVIKASQTTQQALVSAVEQLVGVGGHVSGLTLNNLTKRSGYYYAHHYQSDYFVEEEMVAPQKKTRLAGIANILQIFRVG